MTESQQLLSILREEFGRMRSHVQELSTSLARLEERLSQTRDLQGDVHEVKVKVEEINTGLAVLAKDTEAFARQMMTMSDRVTATNKKVDSLMLSRATLAGYVLASGGVAATAAKFLL